MLGKLVSFLLGERDGDDCEEKSVMNNILYENVEDDWVMVDIQDQYPVLKLENAPVKNLLTEHPSMSVYSLRITNSDGEEEAELEDLESLSKTKGLIINYGRKKLEVYEPVLIRVSEVERTLSARLLL
ncbi:uncharacterized protein si:ch211-260e23.9 [Hypanus sabinus]|uniref:uncharacterized protein si:ch211-260e23.9 n=1 Tax=Hypanus sabinus TaxID=79690 RepID=UPI0028C44F22|nr:uncharacterized protein si:ch211-260e23.9 [Hypanus sabinus]